MGMSVEENWHINITVRSIPSPRTHKDTNM